MAGLPAAEFEFEDLLFAAHTEKDPTADGGGGSTVLRRESSCGSIEIRSPTSAFSPQHQHQDQQQLLQQQRQQDLHHSRSDSRRTSSLTTSIAAAVAEAAAAEAEAGGDEDDDGWRKQRTSSSAADGDARGNASNVAEGTAVDAAGDIKLVAKARNPYQDTLAAGFADGRTHTADLSRLGTSAPVTIPYTSRGWQRHHGVPFATDEEDQDGQPKATTFVPPHLLVDKPQIQFSLNGSTADKKAKLRARNTILRLTGFIEPANSKGWNRENFGEALTKQKFEKWPTVTGALTKEFSVTGLNQLDQLEN